jgi:hypothetical protein
MGAHCVQIECVTYIGDQLDHGIVGNKGKLPAPLTAALAGLIREITAALGGIDVSVFPQLWSSSGAYGSNAPQRLTDGQWEGFNGICGHQHVPNNTHWDPGAFDIKAFAKLLGRDSSGSGAIQAGIPSPPLADWPLLFEEGDRDEQVRIIRGVLQTLGYGNFAPSDLYNPKVADAVTALQRAERITVDGIWGPETHSHARARLDTALQR